MLPIVDLIPFAKWCDHQDIVDLLKSQLQLTLLKRCSVLEMKINDHFNLLHLLELLPSMYFLVH
jgi:hypothetical protein